LLRARPGGSYDSGRARCVDPHTRRRGRGGGEPERCLFLGGESRFVFCVFSDDGSRRRRGAPALVPLATPSPPCAKAREKLGVFCGGWGGQREPKQRGARAQVFLHSNQDPRTEQKRAAAGRRRKGGKNELWVCDVCRRGGTRDESERERARNKAARARISTRSLPPSLKILLFFRSSISSRPSPPAAAAPPGPSRPSSARQRQPCARRWPPPTAASRLWPCPRQTWPSPPRAQRSALPR